MSHKNKTTTTIISLHQRILYPPSNKFLPPRILHSPAHKILDPLLLDLIALICREHILNWYNNLSKDPEKTFIRQVTNIIIQVLQAIELRLISIDLIELILLDFTSLFYKHLNDFDQSKERINSSHAHNLSSDSIFHLLQPHIAISLIPSTTTGVLIPEVDKIYLRALVDNILEFLLPPEDYRAETERAIIKEIIVNIILGSVFDKVAQPWFLHQVIAKILEGREADILEQKESREKSSPASSSEKDEKSSSTLLNSTLSTLASIPPFLKGISITVSTIYNTITSLPVPSHYADEPPITTPLLDLLLILFPPSTSAKQLVHYLQFILSIFSTFFTSLIFYLFNVKLFNVELVRNGLEITTKSLFPNGHPSPKEEDPDEEGKEALRTRCEEAVARTLPTSRLFPISSTTNDSQEILLARHLLRPLSSHVANVHLFVLALDLVVGKLFPEMVISEESE